MPLFFMNTYKCLYESCVLLSLLKIDAMGLRTVITGSGCYIPTEIKTNRDFTVHNFYGQDHLRIATPPTEVVEKFQQITGL